MNLAFKTIVVATDFSDQSTLALEYARVLATRFGAGLRVLHVVEVPTVLAAEVPLPDVEAAAERAIAEARRKIAKTLARLPEGNTIGQVLVGQPADTIVQYASDHDADLVVMGTHGRGGFAHFLVGSVAERVVRSAPCPVFTVRHTTQAQWESRDALTAVA